jgi:hypothetical protein
MADYIIPTSSGTVTVPHDTRVTYKSLTLVGQDELDWNEPIQRNLVILRDLLDTKMNALFDQHLVPTTHGTKDFGTLTKSFRDGYLTGSLYLDGIKAVSSNTGVVTYSGKDGQTVKVKSVGSGNLELGSTGSGKVILTSSLYLSPLLKLRTLDGLPLCIGDPLKVEGPITATTYNGITLSALALKTELPDISDKANRSEIPTKLSQLSNDPGYLTTHQSLTAYATSATVDTQISGVLTTLKGGVAATHDTLAKLKTGYESAVTALTTTVATNKTAAESANTATVGQVTIEKNRALGIESALSTSIATETTRAQSAESLLTGSLNSEVTRASGVETQLRTDLSSEVTRASASEVTIATSVTTEKNRATNAENFLASAGSLEVTNRVNGDAANTAAITAEQTRATSAESGLTGLINTEKSRAQAAEATLDTKINSETTRSVAADNTITSSVLTEKSRAQSAESVLSNEIAAINLLLTSDTLALDTVQELVTAIKANQASLSLIDLSVKVSRNVRHTCMIGGNGIVIT